MADERDDLQFLGALGLVSVGVLIGAATALLLAPRAGRETREILREKGSEWARRAQEQGSTLARQVEATADTVQARAQDYLGRGREALEDTSAQLRAAFEAGRVAMRDEIARLRGQDDPAEGV